MNTLIVGMCVAVCIGLGAGIEFRSFSVGASVGIVIMVLYQILQELQNK